MSAEEFEKFKHETLAFIRRREIHSVASDKLRQPGVKGETQQQKGVKVMKTLKVLIALATFLFCASSASAISINITTYTMLFNPHPESLTADWIGHYTVNEPIGEQGPYIFIFSAVIGNCPNVYDCTYDDPVAIGSFPHGTGHFHEMVYTSSPVGGRMDYFPLERRFATLNFAGTSPQGSYCIVGVDSGCALAASAVPEPPSIWLILAGMAMIALGRFSRRHS